MTHAALDVILRALRDWKDYRNTADKRDGGAGNKKSIANQSGGAKVVHRMSSVTSSTLKKDGGSDAPVVQQRWVTSPAAGSVIILSLWL